MIGVFMKQITLPLDGRKRFEWLAQVAANFEDESVCLEPPWIASNGGYKQVWNPITRKQGLAHRAVMEILDYDLSNPDICVLHKCDNTACCNPKHLFLGTKKDNTQDMLRKGRGPKPRVIPWMDSILQQLNDGTLSGGCIIPPFSTLHWGRPVFKCGNRDITMWRYLLNEYDKSMLVEHSCGNKTCCNPRHMTTISYEERRIRNAQILLQEREQRIQKCQQQKQHERHLLLRGRVIETTIQPKKKLSERDILDIRIIWLTTNRTQQDIAEQFRTTRPFISLIVQDRARTRTHTTQQLAAYHWLVPMHGGRVHKLLRKFNHV